MDEVQAFYDKNAQNEWDRLDRHRTEFAVTLRALKDYLPHFPAEVLDVGGGPGQYSIALAKLGYQVTLLDLSEGCLQLAKKKAQETRVTRPSLPDMLLCAGRRRMNPTGFRREKNSWKQVCGVHLLRASPQRRE